MALRAKEGPAQPVSFHDRPSLTHRESLSLLSFRTLWTVDIVMLSSQIFEILWENGQGNYKYCWFSGGENSST